MKEIDWNKFEKLFDQVQNQIKQKKLDALAVAGEGSSLSDTSGGDMGSGEDTSSPDAAEPAEDNSDDSGLGL